jgi:hypothetical protein
MGLLKTACIERDGGCIVCAEVENLDAHHILPQTIIKDEYGKRGGLRPWVDAYPGAGGGYLPYRPITRFEFWLQPDISAVEIAMDPDTCVTLCRAHHGMADVVPTYLFREVPYTYDLVKELAAKYSMASRLERYYGYPQGQLDDK